MEFTTITNAKKETGLAYLGKVNSSAKLLHSQVMSHQYTYILYLAPASTSGYNVCSHSTPECRMGCLNTSGRAGIEEFSGITKIHDSRIKKTKLFYEEPEFFMAWLIAEIKSAQKMAIRDNFFFSVRLNGTSDIDWANVLINGQNIFEIFPNINFYDYTKNHTKFNNKPTNYHLTYSYTGRNQKQAEYLLSNGYNVAVVFNIKHENELPTQFLGYQVINGDLTDFRIDDAKGIIVGLKWKRIANRIAERNVLNSCFVVNPAIDNNCTYANVHEDVLEMV